MKKINITALLALVAFPFAAAKAGEVCVIASKAPIACKETICSKTGYIFGYGGILFGQENEVDLGGINFDFDYDDGFIAGGGAGIYSDLFCGSRFEIEGIYANSDLDTVSFGGVPAAAIGETETYAVMFNVLKEIPFGCITGYVGGGLGYAWTDFSVGGFSDEDGAFAYQFIAGADLPLTDCLALFVQYKLLGIGDTDYILGATNVNVDSDFSHSVSLGARLSF